jgi:hypothetical protein
MALTATMLGALLFGITMSVVHGSEGGVRAMIGNLSAPWLLIAFGAGAGLGKQGVWRGVLSGLLVTGLALGAFYMTNIWVLGLFGHGVLGDLWFALSSGAYYIRLGLVSGPVMGALGALWRRRHTMGVGLTATGLLVLEPLAWFLYDQRYLSSTWGFILVAVAEICVGVALSIALVVWHRRTATA